MSIEPAVRIAGKMAEAATALLSSLDDAQRDAVCWEWPADDERRTWFFTPTDHGGATLHDFSAAQQRLVMQLVATGLSTAGFATTAMIRGQEDVLDHLEGFRVNFGRERGRDPMLYYVRVFALPGEPQWGWRFGGHHLSLNFTIANDRLISTTPCFMGADPARTPLLGPHLHRPLGGAEDLGRELARSLTEGQQRNALRPVPPVDIVGSNRPTVTEGDRPLPIPVIWRGRFEAEIDQLLDQMQRDTEASLGLTEAHVDDLAFTSVPKGVAGRDLRADQKDLLVETLGTYIRRIDDGLADAQMAKVRRNIDDLHFLWAGSTEPGEPHYYRVHGGDLFVEYDCAQRDGNHVHTVWRDLSLDFGGDPLADHYTHGHDHA